jgi:hypothetical protein
MSVPDHDLGREAGVEIAKLIPPVAVWTLTLNDVLAALSILYVLIQIAFLARKWWLIEKARRET